MEEQSKNQQLKNQKGKLKIFFGYAIGVGKTLAMLKAAKQVKQDGQDVVIGKIDTYQRMHLEKQLLLFEQLAPLDEGEFNLDLALHRKPDLLLLDEIAHINKESSRHAKRYQDIYELLDHGIDVYTTLNVQNIESLVDIITTITSVEIHNRIPDYVFDDAYQVELIDLEPQELYKRFEQGILDETLLQQDHFVDVFSIDKLIALREIALRRCADRSNRKLETIKMNKEGFNKEHVLVCLSSSPTNQKVIRTAARMASAFFGEFSAVFVETPDVEKMSDEGKETLQNNIKLASQLGAKIVNLYGDDIPLQIMQYASSSKVSKIILGRSNNARGKIINRNHFVDKLMQMATQIDVYIIPDYVVDHPKMEIQKDDYRFSFSLKDTFISLSILCIVTLVGIWFRSLGFSESNIIMLHILGVLITSIKTDNIIYTLIASIVSVLSFNFFFTVPTHSFAAYDAGYPITFSIMFITAFITGTLTKRVKEQARLSALKAYRTELLLQSSQNLQLAKDEQAIIEETTMQLKRLLNKTILFYPVDENGLQEPYTNKIDEMEDSSHLCTEQERNVVKWVYSNNRHAGVTTSTLPNVECLYLAVRNNHDVFGVIGIHLKKDRIDSFENNVLMAMLNECALALEKEKNNQRKQEMEIKANQEELRANLLRSISHDLRTPLTSISGNAGILVGNASKMSEEHKLGMYQDIYDDSMWLIHLVENLLSITRIENGAMKIRSEVELINEIILEAIRHTSKDKVDHHIQCHLEDAYLFAKVDSQLIMQVIINVVNNAIKYTQSGSHIDIVATKVNEKIIIEIKDDGEGIPDDSKEKIFDMFFTHKNDRGDSRRGLGLGLALCKSIVEAHNGTITLVDNVPKGAIFVIALPAQEVDIHE